MYSIAVGCSHTVGVGVEPHEAWPNLLGAVNLGVGGCSADYIARNMPKYLTLVVYFVLSISSLTFLYKSVI